MNVGGTLIVIVVVIVVTLICREIVCWYWKINKAVELLASIDNKLNIICGIQQAKDDIKS